VVGVSGQDGSLLWKKPDWKITIANVPSPLVVPGDRLFLSGGYKSGCVMLKLTGENPIQTEEVFRLGPDQFGSEQQTPILYEDHIYGVIPSGELACLSLEGKILWTSGKEHRFGLGPFLGVNGLLLALEDQTGELNMIALNPNSYEELAVAQVLEGHDAWGPMAMVQDRLILRDLTRMICLKLPS
jgi:outer membrane protein assembly factor BamB